MSPSALSNRCKAVVLRSQAKHIKSGFASIMAARLEPYSHPISSNRHLKLFVAAYSPALSRSSGNSNTKYRLFLKKVALSECRWKKDSHACTGGDSARKMSSRGRQETVARV